MKIGILTFHCAHNYGAVLQCYATQEFLRSKGHDVEIIYISANFHLKKKTGNTFPMQQAWKRLLWIKAHYTITC